MIAGVFVGGASSRMGGRPKGRHIAPASDGRARASIGERSVSLAREHCDRVVLVGRADAYVDLALPIIADACTAVPAGPLAGLVSLTEYAGDDAVIAIACDMPYLDGALLARLVHFAPDAAAVAPRHGGVWSPLFARYDDARVRGPARAKLDSGERALWSVLEAVGAVELPLSGSEHATLRDWDEPADIDDARGE